MYLSGLCLREKVHLIKQVNCLICMEIYPSYLSQTQYFIYKTKLKSLLQIIELTPTET